MVISRTPRRKRQPYWTLAAVLWLGSTSTIPIPSHAGQPIVEEFHLGQEHILEVSEHVSGPLLTPQRQMNRPLTSKAFEAEQLEPLIITPPKNLRPRLVKNGHPQSERIVSSSLLDMYFDTQHRFLRGGASAALDEVFSLLVKYPNWELQIQSHCDERGSTAYNVALGARYYQNVRDFFVYLGLPPHRISTISYGEQKQWCDEPSAKCQAENLRLQYGFQVLSPNHSRLGCFTRILAQTRNRENELQLNRPSLSLLQPLHLAQSQ